MFRTAFGDVMGTTMTFCFLPFRSQEISAEDCEHLGHPSTSCTAENMKKVLITVSNDQGTPISENVSMLDPLHGTY